MIFQSQKLAEEAVLEAERQSKLSEARIEKAKKQARSNPCPNHPRHTARNPGTNP